MYVKTLALATLWLIACTAQPSPASPSASPPASPQASPSASGDIDDDILDEGTAKFLEVVGSLTDSTEGDDDDDMPDTIDFEPAEEGNNSSQLDIVNAKVNDDGDIEIEDMILSPEMFGVMFPHVWSANETATIHKRAAVSARSRLWPGGKITYAYSSRLAGNHSKIRAAMDDWERNTCLKFEYKKPGDKSFAVFRTKYEGGKIVGVCSSSVGYTRKLQYVNLAKACFTKHTLLHEIGHLLGLIHEHQHPDRDEFITIIWSNIQSKKQGNFRIPKNVSSHGIQYDPTSVMHYRSKAFANSKCKKLKWCKTIQAKASVKLIRAKQLSKKSDIPIINKLYCNSSRD